MLHYQRLSALLRHQADPPSPATHPEAKNTTVSKLRVAEGCLRPHEQQTVSVGRPGFAGGTQGSQASAEAFAGTPDRVLTRLAREQGSGEHEAHNILELESA